MPHAEWDAVIFDLGGVLVDWDPRYLYRKLFSGDEAGMERFLATVTTPAWNLEQDRGRSFAEAVALLREAHPQQAELGDAYFDRWPEMLGGAIDGTVDVLAELRAADVELHAITNWSDETFPHAVARFPWLAWFKTITVSGRERLLKPDAAIFRLMLGRTGLDAHRCVFVDDLAANADAASALGMHGIVFTSPRDLHDALRRLRLL